MSGKIKLSLLLSRRDDQQKIFKNATADNVKLFKNNEKKFNGQHKTFEALPDCVDQPDKRGTTKVQAIVGDTLDWYKDDVTKFVDLLVSIEETNSGGTAKAMLVVDGVEWGEFSANTLLRLRGFLSNSNLINMYETLPVRDESKLWKRTSSALYSSEDAIYETELQEGLTKTTVKENYILPDPNFANKENMAGYVPMEATRTTQIDTGKYTRQEFSGAWSVLERAQLLRRLSNLRNAINDALNRANSVEASEIELGEKLLSYIHGK